MAVDPKVIARWKRCDAGDLSLNAVVLGLVKAAKTSSPDPSGYEGMYEGFCQQAEETAAALAGPDAPLAIRLIAMQAAIAHMETCVLSGLSPSKYGRRREQSFRRFLTAVTALEKVRKLRQPIPAPLVAVQVVNGAAALPAVEARGLEAP
jgi:hypothetical protein